MPGARVFAAHRAWLDLIGGEEGHCLLHTAGPVSRAHQAPRRVGAAQMLRAMHLSVHHAHCPVRRAYRPAAARAFRDLIHADRLVRAALAVLEARRAQTPASLRRIRPALLRVPVAHDTAPAAAGPAAGRAGGGPLPGPHPPLPRSTLP